MEEKPVETPTEEKIVAKSVEEQPIAKREGLDRTVSVTRQHCLFTMISAAVVVVCVCIGVTMNLTTIHDENFDHMGLRTFCMFTVNSNILMGASMALVFPYSLDGLRKHNFHLPRWVVDMVYAGVTAVALTFLISLCVLAPVKGFVLIFTGSRFFLHGLCPILAIVAFCFFISEQRIRFRDTLFALVPVLIYAVLYYVMVVVLGEDRGGWNDFYGFATRLPVWIPMVSIMPLTFLIATVIRIFHNRTFDKRRQEEAAYFSEIFAHADSREIVAAMARFHRESGKGRDIVVPGRVIAIMVENNEGDCTWEECCGIYLKEYLQSNEAMDIKKLWF